MTLSDIECLVAHHVPASLIVSAVEDHDAVLVRLWEPPNQGDTHVRETSFAVSRLQLASMINPHAMLEVLTHEAVLKFAA